MGNKNRKIVLVHNPVKVALLESLGFRHNGTRDIGNGKVAYQFILSDDLHFELKNNGEFSGRDYCFDTRNVLTF